MVSRQVSGRCRLVPERMGGANRGMSVSRLAVLPCLDSEEMAERRTLELQILREVAATLGRPALRAAQACFYVTGTGGKVVWRNAVELACASKHSIPPGEGLPAGRRPFAEAKVQVTNDTTLGASRRLVEQGLRPLAVNFANGICPGGRFLSGARPQEEVLCRSSALHVTLAGDPMYEVHRKREEPDSTDWAICSPDVPVFRTDDGAELDEFWLLSFITCAAPYAPAIGQPRARDLLGKRIRRVLGIARSMGHSALVLGAWGCGAFRNDPSRTAADFRRAVEEQAAAFSDVVFAIADWSSERRTLGPFREVFSRGGSG